MRGQRVQAMWEQNFSSDIKFIFFLREAMIFVVSYQICNGSGHSLFEVWV